MPGIVGWNLVRLAYEEFVKQHGGLRLGQFDHTASVDPLLFSQFHVFHYTDVRKSTVNEIHEHRPSLPNQL